VLLHLDLHHSRHRPSHAPILLQDKKELRRLSREVTLSSSAMDFWAELSQSLRRSSGVQESTAREEEEEEEEEENEEPFGRSFEEAAKRLCPPPGAATCCEKPLFTRVYL